jgi:tRNA dimethylallyltransferase
MRRAEAVCGVIVNADSQQLYAGLRILTARPGPADEAALPHRLYGIADPADSWSVGRWLAAVEDLLASETRPLVIVGGTGLYFHALLKGLAPVPPVADNLRQDVEAAWLNEGEAAFRRRLAGLDPAAEARIAPADRQRLVRALAVAVGTGRPLSDWQADTAPATLRAQDCERWVVERERSDLYRRCDDRVDQMLATGAIGEVKALLERDLAPDLPAMRAVGVRDLAAHLRGELPLNLARERIKQTTRHYAKRQLTWFRNQTPDWPRLDLSEL